MSIDYNKFIQTVVQYLKNNKKTVTDLKKNCHRAESCWGQITTSMFGTFNRIKSLALYTAWKKKQ